MIYYRRGGPHAAQPGPPGRGRPGLAARHAARHVGGARRRVRGPRGWRPAQAAGQGAPGGALGRRPGGARGRRAGVQDAAVGCARAGGGARKGGMTRLEALVELEFQISPLELFELVP